MPRIVYTHSYIRRAKKFFRQHPELLGQYEKALRLLQTNPSHPSLKLHKLTRRRSDLYAVYINKSYRITIELIIKEDTIIPVSVGSHDQVY